MPLPVKSFQAWGTGIHLFRPLNSRRGLVEISSLVKTHKYNYIVTMSNQMIINTFIRPTWILTRPSQPDTRINMVRNFDMVLKGIWLKSDICTLLLLATHRYYPEFVVWTAVAWRTAEFEELCRSWDVLYVLVLLGVIWNYTYLTSCRASVVHMNRKYFALYILLLIW